MIQPLDIILTSRKHFDIVSSTISFITDGPSHAMWYLGEGTFWEQTFPVARFGKMSEIDRNEYEVEIRRHPKLVDNPPGIHLFHKALLQCGKLEGSPYDIPELVWTQFWEALGVDAIDFDKSLFVCSSAINYMSTEIGYPFFQGIGSPADLVRNSVRVEEEIYLGELFIKDEWPESPDY